MLIRRSSKKGLRKNGSCVRQCPRITHTHTHIHTCTKKRRRKKGKDGHRRRHLDQGTLCQKNVSLLPPPFRFARARYTPYYTYNIGSGVVQKRTKTSAKGAHTKCLARDFFYRTKLSIFATVSQLHARVYLYIIIYVRQLN